MQLVGLTLLLQSQIRIEEVLLPAVGLGIRQSGLDLLLAQILLCRFDRCISVIQIYDKFSQVFFTDFSFALFKVLILGRQIVFYLITAVYAAR